VNGKQGAPTPTAAMSRRAEMTVETPTAAHGVAKNAPKRLTLGDLKAAAKARREAAQAAGADYPHLT
jgi:hypothetical protein